MKVCLTKYNVKNEKKQDIMTKELCEMDNYIIENFNNREEINGFYKCNKDEIIRLYYIEYNEIKYIRIFCKDDCIKVLTYLKEKLLNNRELIFKLINDNPNVFDKDVYNEIKVFVKKNYNKQIMGRMRGFVKRVSEKTIANNIRPLYKSIKEVSKTDYKKSK